MKLLDYLIPRLIACFGGALIGLVLGSTLLVLAGIFGIIKLVITLP